EKKLAIAFAQHYQRVLEAELVERGLGGFGFRLGQIERLDDKQLAVFGAIGNRNAERGAPRLFRHLVRIVARLRAEDGSAVTPQRRSRRPCARASGSLLPPRLAAAAGDESLGLGGRRSSETISKLHPDRLVQQRQIAVAAENCAGDFELADFFMGGRVQRQLDRR